MPPSLPEASRYRHHQVAVGPVVAGAGEDHRHPRQGASQEDIQEEDNHQEEDHQEEDPEEDHHQEDQEDQEEDQEEDPYSTTIRFQTLTHLIFT